MTATDTARHTGRCTRGHAFALDLAPGEMNNPVNRACPCGALRVKTSVVVGRLSETKCDPRCTSALSGSCDCSCAGKNHGADHLA